MSILHKPRCPICKQGHVGMLKTCPYCQSRFERNRADQVGGVYLTALAAFIAAVVGFLVVDALFHPVPLLQLVFWIPFAVGFALLFYPRARGFSVAINALRGKVYPDFDCEREYITQKQIAFGKTPQEHE